MVIEYSKLRFPKELVFFTSLKQEMALLVNPELGTYATFELKYLGVLQACENGMYKDMSEVDNLFSTLIIRRVIYYGAFEPTINEYVPPIPQSLYWETTHGCSLRCEYCYMSADTILPGELTTAEAVSLIDQAAELGIQDFMFTGGEPLIRKDIFELGKYAKNKGLVSQLITNSTLITSSQIAKQVSESFEYVTTSLDGATPWANDVHRGSGSFDKIVKGIRSLNAVGVMRWTPSYRQQSEVS